MYLNTLYLPKNYCQSDYRLKERVFHFRHQKDKTSATSAVELSPEGLTSTC